MIIDAPSVIVEATSVLVVVSVTVEAASVLVVTSVAVTEGSKKLAMSLVKICFRLPVTVEAPPVLGAVSVIVAGKDRVNNVARCGMAGITCHSCRCLSA